MGDRYTIKRTSRMTWEIVDWKTMKIIYNDLSLSEAKEIVENLEKEE